MKKRLFALLLVLALLLTGCGGAAKDTAENGAHYDAPMEEMKGEIEAPAEAPGAIVQSSTASDVGTVTEQKLIRRVNMEAETEDLESLLPVVAAKIAELGGYVESQELYNGSIHSSYRSRSVYMVVRIPAERLGEFTEQVEGSANVISYSETADDVTLQYVDTESRIKALQVEQERLLELLAKAETMADLLEIEARLTDVRYELERYTANLRGLENKVNYATVSLNIRQVRVLTEPEPETLWQRISSGFGDNLEDIGEDLTDFVVWLVVYSPQLILIAAVVIAIALLLRRKIRIRWKKNAPADNQEEK